MWDDHEVRDNWYHAQVLPAESPYTEKRVAVLAERARQAFLEHYPVTMARGADARSIARSRSGPLVEVFALDMRSYRGANNENLQPARAPTRAFLGSRAGALARRRAGAIDARRGRSSPPTCRSASSSRISPAVMKRSPTATTERALGRELEIAGLLSTLKARARPQRRLDHRRRALLRGAPLRSGARGGEGLRSVLGVHRRPGARGDVCARRARCHVRSRGALPWRAADLPPNRPPGCGPAVLWPCSTPTRERRR